MAQRMLVDGQQTLAIQTASLSSVIEEAAALAEELFNYRSDHLLVCIWYARTQEVRHQAYRSAQTIYGLPGAKPEDQEAQAGQILFWTNVRNALERDLNLARRNTIDNQVAAA